MSGAERLRFFVGFWHPVEPLPVHAPPPTVTDHPHPISFRKPTLQDLSKPLLDLKMPHPDASIEVEVLPAECSLAVNKLARKRVVFVSYASHDL
jgi:hypothetical protein